MAKSTQIIIEIDAKGTPRLKGQTQAIKEQTKALKQQGTTTRKTEKRARSFHSRQEKGVIGVANQTKSFSKMAQSMDGGGGGAGGLVRAYALLAANVFALSMAFGVLSRSAQIDTLTKAMERLELVSGKAIRGLARDLQEASGYGMDFADSMRATSLALSAGFQTETIQELAEVARNASVSLGRNMADGLDRIFRGVIKVEPELLDEIGLFVRVREAAARYAADIGVAAADLTEFQRRQAFANEALRQGKEKFQDFADIPTDIYSQLSAKISDIAQKILSMLNNVLGPMIKLISESQAALGFLMGMVAIALLKKAIPAMGYMTKSTAEQAATARKGHLDFVKSVDTRGSMQRALALEEHNIALKKIEDNLKVNKSSTAAVKKTFSITGGGQFGGQKARKAEEKFDKARRAGLTKENKLIMHGAALEKQGALSSSKKRATKKATIVAIEKEQAANEVILKSLKNQLGLHKEILRVEEEEARLGVQKGTFAHKTEARLAKKEITSQSLATVSATAETQGLRVAFKQINQEAKNMRDGLTESGRSVGFFGRSMFKLKGTFGVLATGVNKLMMTLGPLMIAFTLLMPLFMKIAKALGFMSDESKKLKKAKSALSEQTETLSKVTEHQTQVMNSGKTTALQYLDAHLAFGHVILATIKGIRDLQKADEEFQEHASKSAKWWDARVLGMKQLIDRAFQYADVTNMQIEFDFRPPEEKAFQSMIDKLVANRSNMSEELGAILGMGGVDMKGVDIAIKTAIDAIEPLKVKLAKANRELAKVPIGRREYEERNAIQDEINALKGKIITAERHRSTILYEQEGTQKRILDQQQREVDGSENLKSIREGARDALREFRDQFIEKTTIDKPLTVMNQLVEGLDANNKKLFVGEQARSKQLKEIIEEKDAIFQMLSIERQEAYKVNETEEDRIGILRDQAREYKETQKILKRTATILKDIQKRQSLIKNLVKFTTEGIKEHFKLEQKKRKVALDLEKIQLRTRLIDAKIRETTIQETFDKGKINTLVQKMLDGGLARGQAEDIIRDLMKLETQELEDQWKTSVEIFEQQDGIDKLLQKRLKVQEQINKAIFDEWQMQQKLTAFARTGSTTLLPSEKIQAVVKEEAIRLKTSQQLAVIERKLIASKFARLREEYRLLALMNKLEDRKAMNLANFIEYELTILSVTKKLTTDEEKMRLDANRESLALAIKLSQAGTDEDPYTISTATIDAQEILDIELVDRLFKNSTLKYSVALRDAVSAALEFSFSTDIMRFEDTNIFKLFDKIKSARIFKDILVGDVAAAQEQLETSKTRKTEIEALPYEQVDMSVVKEYGDLTALILALQIQIDRLNTENIRNEFNMASSVLMNFANQVRELSSGGFLAATVAEFAVGMGDAFLQMNNNIRELSDTTKTYIIDAKGATEEKLAEAQEAGKNIMTSAEEQSEKTVQKLQVASAAVAGIGSIMAANSKRRVAAVDQEIAAEKKRDGKSKESIAKIKKLEQKKEAIKRKAFEANKKMMMAQVIIDTAAGIMKTIGETGFFGIPLAVIVGAMGAMNLALIASTSYQGGGTAPEASTPASISVGKRTNKVDVSKQASAGELAYLRGERGIGTSSTNFIAQGGAAGLRKGYAGGHAGMQGFLVGERGPEMMQTASPFNVVPNDALGASGTSVNFTINAIDAAGVEEVLMGQQGNIISMIRTAANDYGEEFLEAVNTDTYGFEGPAYGFEEEQTGG